MDWLILLWILIRWGRWKDILTHGRFKKQLTEWDVESICRALLSYCLVHYRGDDKIKSFMWDLIAPTEDGRTKELQNHLGKCKILQTSLNRKLWWILNTWRITLSSPKCPLCPQVFLPLFHGAEKARRWRPSPVLLTFTKLSGFGSTTQNTSFRTTGTRNTSNTTVTSTCSLILLQSIVN